MLNIIYFLKRKKIKVKNTLQILKWGNKTYTFNNNQISVYTQFMAW